MAADWMPVEPEPTRKRVRARGFFGSLKCSFIDARSFTQRPFCGTFKRLKYGEPALLIFPILS
jgi:hypothetical protein